MLAAVQHFDQVAPGIAAGPALVQDARDATHGVLVSRPKKALYSKPQTGFAAPAKPRPYPGHILHGGRIDNQQWEIFLHPEKVGECRELFPARRFIDF